MKLASLAAGLALSALSASELSAADALPKFSQSAHYKQVRATLIELGWQPMSLHPGGKNCGIDGCPPYTEVMFCSGTGRAACLYGWQKGNTFIQITGVFEDYENQQFDELRRCTSITQDREHPHIWNCN